jgi:DNA-binding CsgD family transcriptional regulator
MLAAGMTDREIAAALSIGRRTVESHVGRLLAKLGAPTRTAAAHTAIATGLVAPRPPSNDDRSSRRDSVDLR